MKKLLALICGLSISMGATANLVNAEGDEVTQTVLYTMVSDTTNTFLVQNLSGTEYGEPGFGLTDELAYNGTKSYKVVNSKQSLRYRAYNDEPISAASTAVADAIDAGTAYICGWFYADGAGMAAHLIADGVTDPSYRSEIHGLPVEKWVFLSAKIEHLDETHFTNGVVNTNGAGTIYIDDLCVISTSDGSEPKPTSRTISSATEPNRYTKTLRNLYTDGFDYARNYAAQHVTAVTDTDRKKVGANALKFTGQLFLGYNNDEGDSCRLGQISEEITAAVNAGNAYWTAWAYVDTENTNDRGESFSLRLTDLNPRTRGQWIWICMPLNTGNLNDQYMYLDSRGVYTWIDDVKIVTFEDVEKKVLFDDYEVTGVGEGTVAAGGTITVSGAVYNNTLQTENLLLIIAEYNSAGGLVDAKVFNKGKALAYNDTLFTQEYEVSQNTGNQIKVMLWNGADDIKPLHSVESYTIE